MSFRMTGSLADLLLKAQQLKALERPSNRDYRSVLNFMENDRGQLYKKDMAFVYEKEDLVTLRPGREHAWLDGLLERTLKVLRCRLIRVGDAQWSFCARYTDFSYKFLFCSKVSSQRPIYILSSNTGNAYRKLERRTTMTAYITMTALAYPRV